MVRMVTDELQTTSRELQEHLAADGVVVHRSTIQCTLHQEKLIRRVMHKKPFLSVRHKKSRMRYGKAHLDKPEAFWKKILWSDETKIDLFGQNKRMYAWQKKHTEFHEKNLLPTVKFDGGSIMLWGCVASTGTGNLVKVEGHMNSSQ